MREGILEQLPKTLDPTKTVLVVGTDRVPGIKGLRELANQLNNGHDWVRLEIREQMSEGQLTSRTAVVLTMITTNHGNLQKIRNAAKSYGICMVPQALTISEAKEVLNHLAKLRHEDEKAPSSPAATANESRRPVAPPISTKAEVVPEPPVVNPEPEPVTAQAEEVEHTPNSDPAEVNAALAALDNFSVAFSETQYAVLTVGERLKEVVAERDRLKEDLEAKGAEIADLRGQLGKAADTAKENTTLTAKNKELQAEVQRLQEAFDNLESLIKGARKK